VLEPLRLDHAEEVGAALRDERLHGYIGGHPATLDQLRQRYGRLVTGSSEHQASIGVARRLGMAPTTVMVDGETRWTSEFVDWHQDRGGNPG